MGEDKYLGFNLDQLPVCFLASIFFLFSPKKAYSNEANNDTHTILVYGEPYRCKNLALLCPCS